MNFGLSETTCTTIRHILERYSKVEKAVIYGSRAKGNYKNGSDIDLTLMGDALDHQTLSEIAGELDDSFIPYTVDLSLYAALNHAKLREHIDRVGVVFYERGTAGQHQGVAIMKKGWPTEPLVEICEVFADGDWVESKDQSPEGIRLIQTGNIGKGVFKDRAEKARYISEATFKRLRCTEIFEGDCLVSRLPDPVGRSCILPDTGERMITAVDCTILRFNPKRILPTFFNLYSQSDDYVTMVAKECTGTTRNRISRTNLGLTPIPVPPLDEQERIVGLLDEAFEGIATAKANAEKNLQNARALFESHLQSVFTQRGPGWVDMELGVVAEVQSGGTPSVPEKTYWGGNIPWYSSGELNEIHTTNPERTITDAGLNNSNAKLFPKGSLLIGMYDTAALKMSILDRDGTFNQAIAGVKPNQIVEVEFVLHAINALKPRLLLERRGVRQKNLSLGKIKEIKIPVPPPTEQRVIVSSLRNVVAETQRLASIYERKLAALEALKKSLLHQAFTGEL